MIPFPSPIRSLGVALLIFIAVPAFAQKDPSSEVLKPLVAPQAEPELPSPTSAARAGDAVSVIPAALERLATRFEAGEAEEFVVALSSASDGISADAVGHLMFMRRHIDQAAWFFGTDALLDPSDTSSLNNFAAMVFELHSSDPSGDLDLLSAAHAAARDAAILAPDVAAVHNTLGNVARALNLTEEAVAAGMRATDLAPGEALYWTNLARSLALAGDLDAAAAALAQAHSLDPNGPAVRFTAAALPQVAAPYRQRLGSQCNVNFRCQEICPRSIIGGLMSVTCEMENASAQMACQEGQPYPTSYNCQEDFPEYGILIPGLNSGFSISMPGFSAHVLVDGNGDVRVRVEGGISRGRLGAYVGADGTWSPTNGASFDEFRGGVRVNILPRSMGGGGAADEASGRWGHPPAQIELEGSSSGSVDLHGEAYNSGLIST